MPTPQARSARVLVVDDTPQIHADIRRILAAASRIEPPADPAFAGLLEDTRAFRSESAPTRTQFEIDSATQGQEGLALVTAAVEAGRPYSVAFVDMRMPPGWDGLETIEQLLRADPRLQIVICTAYSDHGWNDIHERLECTDNILVLKKPFDVIEARQMAWALCEKWRLAREAESRHGELAEQNSELKREVERRAHAEVRLVHDALHDVLTDLPNRALISDRIERALAMCKRDPHYHMAIVFLDLDDFKIVNDSLGHSAGDKLLIEVAQRIVNRTRQTDCAARNAGNTTARLGGDEFLVLLDGLRSPEDASYVAQRILESLAQPFAIDGHVLRPSASAGIALGNGEYDDAAALIRDADTALYRAKASGKFVAVTFDSELRREAMSRLRVESELRNAIANGQMFLEYQPIVSLEDLRIVGFESLVRWRHPEHGVIPPNEFVPIAEETGLILTLGAWVLRTACLQTADWRKRLPGATGIFVNVNFSRRQLAAPRFVEDLLGVLAESGLDRHELHVEFTESLLPQGSGSAARAVQRMSDERIEMHIDDFGTACSAPSYLHRVPVSAIKIDRAFLREAGSEGSGGSTIKAIVEMAHARKLKVVAEGVETAEQLALLQRLGCDMGQGFYFSRPLGVEAVESLLRSNRAVAA
jgi:diguanylate cyclase (GGDEF)-like protein